MSGIMNALTGQSTAPNVNLGQQFSTGNSTLANGQLQFDPSTRTIQNQALTGFESLMGQSQANTQQFSQGFQNLGDQFAGNQGALINARMNPLRQQVAQQGGALQRNLERRGVQGTFANQAMTGFGLDSGRALGDAQAQATQDSLNAQAGILGQQQQTQQQGLSFEAGLNQMIQGVGAERFGQELQGLGLSTNTVAQLMGLAQQTAQLQDNAAQKGYENLSDLAEKIGMGMACWVAEELYGTEHEKTHTIRRHVKNHALDDDERGQFFRDYINNGERWAEELREGKHDRNEMMETWDGFYADAIGEQ